jgi:signal transduction histidine kinase
MSLRRFSASTLLGLLVVVPTAVFLTAQSLDPGLDLNPIVLAWIALIAAIELLPVPTWHGVQVSVAYPLLIAIALAFPPEVAAIIAFTSSFDPRELKREITVLRALFNRSQVTLAVFAASSVFHSLSSLTDPFGTVIPAALLSTVVDYVISLGLVAAAVSITYRAAPLTVVKQLLGRGQEFLVSYVGLGLVGTVLAKVYVEVGFWTVIFVIAPQVLTRSLFFRTRDLEGALAELQEREQVLKALSNAMAEERQDERLQIAGYLHDDLAQILFRLSIQLDVMRRYLERGSIDDAFEQLEKIRRSKQDTSDKIRALIRDLHRSPLGPKGLAEALESFTEEMGRDSDVRFNTEVEEVPLPAPIALLIYHIAREGVMNSLKHSGSTEVWISVTERDDAIELVLRDNGVGFDTTAPGPEGHFGTAMMRERAMVGGGTFELTSAPGQGTTITARFPTALLQQPSSAENGPSTGARPDPSSDGTARASRGTSSATEPEDAGSPESVRA